MAYASNFKIEDGPDGKCLRNERGDKVLDWDISGDPIYAMNDKGEPVCGAYLDSTDPTKRCQGKDRKQGGRCAKHSFRGAKRDAYKGKSMAKTLPTSLNADYERILADPNLLSLRQDIAVMEARINQLYAQLEGSTSREIWETLEEIAGRAKIILEAGMWYDSPEIMERVVKQVIGVVAQGGKEYEVWDQIIRTTETKSKLVAQEQKWLTSQAGMVTKEQVAALITMLVRCVQEEVALAIPGHSGEVLCQRIAERISGYITGRPTRPQIQVMNGIPLQEIKVENGRQIPQAEYDRRPSNERIGPNH